MKSTLLTCLLLITVGLSAAGIKIEADKISGCAPLTVNFSGVSSQTNATWSWDFGNGYTSDLQTPSVVFFKAGVFKVNLWVKNKDGVSTVSTNITVNDVPKVDFTVSKSKACANEILNFTNQTTKGDAPIAKYVWGFGDGKTATTANVQHQYAASGNYNVTLVVTDINGCSADKTSYSSILVNPVPSVNFTPSVVSSCAESQKVTFTNSSTGNKLTYAWDFGDGSTSTNEAPSHLFEQGKSNITLTAKDANECSSAITKTVSVTKLSVDFLTANETPSNGESVKFYSTSNYKGTSWAWDFGDGTSSTLHSPDKIYSTPGNYTVKFTLTDGVCSQTKTKTAYIKVIKGTPVTFTSNITSSCTSPMSVKFTNTTPNTALALWEFGDGTVSTSPNPEKVFTNPGTYKVTLSVTDSSGYTVKKDIDDFIQTAKPMVRFGGETFGCIGYPVKFSNFTPNATSYLWNFGDGETSTKKDPSHIYKKNGFYTITLNAKNGAQCDSTLSLTNFVHIDSVKADFEMASTKSVVPPFLCTFTNTTLPDNVKFIWDFGDGTTETSANPVHLYETPGTFKVRLIAYTKSGCSSTKVLENTYQMGTASDSPIILDK